MNTSYGHHLEPMNFNDAKSILNKKNESPYTDQEIKEIIELLKIMSDMISDNLSPLNN